MSWEPLYIPFVTDSEPPESVEFRNPVTCETREYVPVVRCRDCKHFTPNKEFWLEPPKVPFPMIGATSDCCDFWADTECKVSPDGFCACGERRDA